MKQLVALILLGSCLTACATDPAQLAGWTETVEAGGSSRAFAYLQGTSSTSDLTTYTFSSQNFGDADTDRNVIITLQCRAATQLTLNSATISGVSATIDRQSGFANNTVAVISAAVPTGTSGDVVVTWSGGAVRCAIQVYRAVGGLTVHATASGNTTSTTINVESLGVLVGSAVNSTSGDTHTWTGLTKQDEATVEAAVTVSTAAVDDPGAETGRTVQCDPAGVDGPYAVVSYTLAAP